MLLSSGDKKTETFQKNNSENNSKINSTDTCKVSENYNKSTKNLLNSKNLSNLDDLLLDESIQNLIEQKLKYTPKSDFIYNKELPKNLEELDKDKMIHFIKQLFADHYRVCRENEQFRTQNFKQYIQLRKLGALETHNK